MTPPGGTDPLNIGIFGTFDVENYGDLLFPLIAEAELARRLGRVTMTRYSYASRAAADWPYVVTSLSELPAAASRLDGVLLGGGHIIRFDKHVATGYGPPDASIHHPTGYWLTPALVAIAHGLPIAWNAPGVVDEMPDWAVPTLRLVLAASDYVSVRDEGARRALEPMRNGAPVMLVPDTAFGVASLLDSERRSRDISRFREAARVPGPYVLVQASRDSKPFVRFIRKEAASFSGLRFLVLPVGPINRDDEKMFASDECELVRLAKWPDPLLLASLISGAEGVVGGSLHLGITALAFGVPVFRPARMNRGKYEMLLGFRTVFPFDVGITPAWLRERLGRADPDPEVASISLRLEEHWDRIAAVFAAGRRRTPATLEALSHFWQALPGLLEASDLGEAVRGRDERIAALEASTSWKVTAPLRSVGRRLRGWRRAGR